MDKFLVFALGLMLVSAALITAASYVGQALQGADMEGTDALVEENAASTAGKEPTPILPAVSEEMEPIAFTIAGIVSGFVMGMLWYDLFERGD